MILLCLFLFIKVINILTVYPILTPKEHFKNFFVKIVHSSLLLGRIL